MRRTTWGLTLFVSTALAVAAVPEQPPNVFESPIRPAAASPIDRLVFARLGSLGIQPTLCSEAAFVRRAYLDVIGTLPTAQEARDFLQDPDTASKRRRLIDRLLERDEFADYWAMKWGDILRIKAEFPVNLWPNAAQAYHRWVRASIAENKPYDNFVRELLTSSGSNFRVGPVNFYRAIQNRTPEGTAAAVALTFMGSRVDSWPKDRLAGMAAFFSQVGYKPTREWKEEHVFWDRFKPDDTPAKSPTGNDKSTVPPVPSGLSANRPPRTAVFPDGTKILLSASRDPREVFTDWLISPRNHWFTRNIANRVWAWLLGRGIIHEPDDIRDGNPPSNPELLAYLEKELVDNHYDLKHLYRLILNSNTYQMSSMPRFSNPKADANFASYPLRRLDAEVLIDAINKVTGTTDLYTSPIPEPFTYIPQDKPAIAIADGSITSPFLTLFGRSARATGMENERNNKPVPAQWLYLLNSSQIQRKIDQGPRLKAIIESGRKPEEIVEDLYLTILSRRPTADELQTALDYGKPAVAAKSNKPSKPGDAKPGAKGKAGIGNQPPAANKAGTASKAKAPIKLEVAKKAAIATKPAKPPVAKRRDQWVDIAWALINSTEFLYRH
jgi:hypothetical protein